MRLAECHTRVAVARAPPQTGDVYDFACPGVSEKHVCACQVQCKNPQCSNAISLCEVSARRSFILANLASLIVLAQCGSALRRVSSSYSTTHMRGQL